MFAHAVGMGLFEKKKLRWLEDTEWAACGYIVEKGGSGSVYRLKREPLRRFEDIDTSVPSVVLNAIEGSFWNALEGQVIDAIAALAAENPTLGPDDVGIIFIDNDSTIYKLADQLAISVPRHFGWTVNLAHESKRRQKGQLFISNRNNVKGLEFPFVICISQTIGRGYMYRNALYMTMTRSFIQSYLIISKDSNSLILPEIQEGLKRINEEGCIEVSPPTQEDQKKIKTTITYKTANLSFFDLADKIFDEYEVMAIIRPPLLDIIRNTQGEDPDLDEMRDTVEKMLPKMMRAHGNG